MLSAAASMVLLARGRRWVGEIGFLVLRVFVGHVYFPMMKFNEMIRMMRVTVIENHP
jgi:hypothetical protein